jgi:hypothetical protein
MTNELFMMSVGSGYSSGNYGYGDGYGDGTGDGYGDGTVSKRR